MGLITPCENQATLTWLVRLLIRGVKGALMVKDYEIYGIPENCWLECDEPPDHAEIYEDNGNDDAYPYKAVNADDQGHQMEGCWARPDAPEPFEALVNVFMIEAGSANVGTFRQHLFSAEKKRWSDSGMGIVKSTL